MIDVESTLRAKACSVLLRTASIKIVEQYEHVASIQNVEVPRLVSVESTIDRFVAH